MSINKKTIQKLIKESLREHISYLFENEEKENKEEKDLNFSFKTRISDNLIKVTIEKNDKKTNVKIEPDDIMRKLGPNPLSAMALSYLKMKDLEGYDDSESKKLFQKISEFVKELDQSITAEDPEEVLEVLEDKKIGLFNPVIEKIKDLFSGNKDLII